MAKKKAAPVMPMKGKMPKGMEGMTGTMVVPTAVKKKVKK